MKGKENFIKIQYKLIGEQEWTTINLTPQDYFDLDDGEAIEVNSIPMYNHALDYIKNISKEVVNTKITIEDTKTKEKIIITESFWNKQQNRIIEKIFNGSDCNEELIIVETKDLANEQILYETLYYKYKLKLGAVDDILTAVVQQIASRKRELEQAKSMQ